MRNAILLKLNIEYIDIENNFLHYLPSSLITGKIFLDGS
jgi:hypothetical protein